jgi:hypothetical protein
MRYKADEIFTPQGILQEVEKNPNLDFLMNIFNIPRAFGVSGFGGNWNVGMHSVACCFLALQWAKFNNFDRTKRDNLITQALVHDLHEAVTGDILPMFKSKTVKKQLQAIQQNILASLAVEEDDLLKIDLKIIDLVAFLYEIKQVSPNILQPKKLKLAHTIAEKQTKILYTFCKENGISFDKIQRFLAFIEI